MKWQRIDTLTLLIFIGLFCVACAAASSDSMQAPAQTEADRFAVDESASDAELPHNLTDTRKIIANAYISLVVAETEAAVDRIGMITFELGGYLADVDLAKGAYGETEALRGSLTLRVPAEHMEDALARLQALATDMRNLNVSRQDVTDQYSDIEAQLRNLRATEKELLALLAEVRRKPNATAEDILVVHRSLTEIRGEIETVQGRKNLLDNQIGFSTIWVELIPDSINRPIIGRPWNAAGPTRNALRALVLTVQWLLTALIWVLLYVTPLLLLFLIPLAVAVWLVRLWLRHRRAKEGE